MSLQQTKDGIVLHRVGNLTVGKGYTLSHDDKTYSIHQDYEIRTKNQDKQQDKGKGFGEWFFLLSFQKNKNKKNKQNRIAKKLSYPQVFLRGGHFLYFNIF